MRNPMTFPKYIAQPSPSRRQLSFDWKPAPGAGTTPKLRKVRARWRPPGTANPPARRVRIELIGETR
jgi:hypothetical protein